MEKYNILFLNENSLYKNKNAFAYVGLASLESYLKAKGLSCKTIHFSEIDRYLDQSDVFGISVLDHTYELARKVTQYLRGKKVIWGGATATALPEYILKTNSNVDYIILHEGEQRLLDLLLSFNNPDLFAQIDGIAYRNILGKIIVRPPQRFMDMNDLPIPTDLVVMEGKYVYVELSRGCYGGCHYCQEVLKMRFKDPEHVVKEILYWVSLGYTDFLWGDANAIANGELLKEVVDRIEKAKEKITVSFSGRPEDIIREQKIIERIFQSSNVKVDVIEVGIEANTKRMLELIGRRTTPEINDNAMAILLDLRLKYSPKTNICANMILFSHWDMTLGDFIENVKFIGKYKCSREALSLNLQGLASTPIWHEMKERGFSMQMNKGCQISEYPFSDMFIEKLYSKLIRMPKKKLLLDNNVSVFDQFKLQRQVHDQIIEFYNSPNIKDSICEYMQ